MSKVLGELLLRALMRDSRRYEKAMQAFLVEKPLKLKQPGTRYPTRESLYDRKYGSGGALARGPYSD